MSSYNKISYRKKFPAWLGTTGPGPGALAFLTLPPPLDTTDTCYLKSQYKYYCTLPVSSGYASTQVVRYSSQLREVDTSFYSTITDES